jgi:hypothetical protein
LLAVCGKFEVATKSRMKNKTFFVGKVDGEVSVSINQLAECLKIITNGLSI